jgi:hypothetical protein
VLLEAGDRRVGLGDGRGRGLVIDWTVDGITKAFRVGVERVGELA